MIGKLTLKLGANVGQSFLHWAGGSCPLLSLVALPLGFVFSKSKTIILQQTV